MGWVLLFIGVVAFGYWLFRPEKCSCGVALTKETELKDKQFVSSKLFLNESKKPYIEDTYRVIRSCKQCQKVLSIKEEVTRRDNVTTEDIKRAQFLD